MKRAIVLLALLLAGCYGGDDVTDAAIRYHHDARHQVGCWTWYGQAIHCLPDSQYTR